MSQSSGDLIQGLLGLKRHGQRLMLVGLLHDVRQRRRAELEGNVKKVALLFLAEVCGDAGSGRAAAPGRAPDSQRMTFW